MNIKNVNRYITIIAIFRRFICKGRLQCFFALLLLSDSGLIIVKYFNSVCCTNADDRTLREWQHQLIKDFPIINYFYNEA